MNNIFNLKPTDVTTRYIAAHTLTGQHTALHVEARHVASRRIAPLLLAGTLLATLALGCIPAYALTAAGSPTGSVEYTQGQLVDEAGTVLLTNRFPVITLDWDAAASYPKLNESLSDLIFSKGELKKNVYQSTKTSFHRSTVSTVLRLDTWLFHHQEHLIVVKNL